MLNLLLLKNIAQMNQHAVNQIEHCWGQLTPISTVGGAELSQSLLMPPATCGSQGNAGEHLL